MYYSTCKEQKIVKLKAPILQPRTVLTKLSSVRPMREGSFNISTENVGRKFLVHCYGHGGSGWTTLWGSVTKAIGLFKASDIAKDVPIRVIGSGCMGLNTAVELKRQGYQVAGITTNELYNLPSWVAAGYFAICAVKTSIDEQDNLNAIGVETFTTYQKIGRGEHPFISRDSVRYIPVYCSSDTESGLEDLEAKGLIPPHENVTLDFGSVQHPNFFKYMTYFIDTTKLMKQLHSEVKRLQIPIEINEVKSFDFVKEQVIFNCSGLGARELNQDDKMVGVRGHVIFLSEESGNDHMDYMIYTKVRQDDKEEYIYMFPKSVSVTSSHPEGLPGKAVIGGTFIPNVETLSSERLAQLDALEFKRLLDRNSLFFHGVNFPAE